MSLSAWFLDWKLHSVHRIICCSMYIKALAVYFFLKPFYFPTYIGLSFEKLQGENLDLTYQKNWFSFHVYSFLSSFLQQRLCHRMGKLFWTSTFSSKALKPFSCYLTESNSLPMNGTCSLLPLLDQERMSRDAACKHHAWGVVLCLSSDTFTAW